METYKIPLIWQMYGHCYIDASSLKNAIEIALGPDTPLPDGVYVDDSVAVDYEVLELDQDKKNSALTKQELRSKLQQGHTLNELLAFGPGQDCEIFKADKFHAGDVVIYVPDVALNHIPLDRPITGPEELDEVLSQCYTGQDFIDECSGDTKRAGRLFCYCDWQHPSSAVDELADDEENAYRYMADAVELSDTEAEYLGLDMRQYRATIGENADDPAAPFSAGGDYGPADPWDAPGMSISDFL